MPRTTSVRDLQWPYVCLDGTVYSDKEMAILTGSNGKQVVAQKGADICGDGKLGFVLTPKRQTLCRSILLTSSRFICRKFNNLNNF